MRLWRYSRIFIIREIRFILVTHEHDIAQHAHRIIFIRDGKIASDQVVKK